MAHDAHASNAKAIWRVFIILSIITTFEVWMGIIKPEVLHMHKFLGMNLLNWMFYLLTLVKAYFIVWDFMHMRGEKGSLRWTVVSPVIFLVLYLLFILLVEADYIFEVFRTSTIKWNF